MLQHRRFLALLSLIVASSPVAPTARAQQGAAEPAPTYSLRGRVTEETDSAKGVRSAEIELPGEGRSVSTDSTGRFVVRGLEPGVYAVVVRSMGYRALRHRVVVDREGIDLGRWSLARIAVSLSEVRINGTMRRVPARFEQVYARAARGFGTFIGREELDKMRPADVQSVLMTVPTARATERGIAFSRCGDYMGKNAGGSVVSVYIDGTRMYPPPGGADERGTSENPFTWRLSRPEDQRGPGSTMTDVFGLVAVKDIQAIEVFKGVSQLPAEFNNDACAVVAIWTRSY